MAEVDVVERGPCDGDGGDADAAALERRQPGGDGPRPMVRARPQRALLARDVAHALEPGERLLHAAAPGLRELDLHGVAPQLALQALRRALRDDAAALDDRQPRREPV